jgi:glucose/arabinose dehydrogenase
MQRRTLLKGGILVPAALAFSETAPASAAPHIVKTLARGIDVPWHITFLADGDALVSARDTGRIIRVRKEGGHHSIGHVPGVVSGVSQGGETGLLGLALHPNFKKNRWLYAYHSTSSDNRVVRMRYVGGGLGSPHVILKGIPKSLHHNGGGLAFGPGGKLFVSTGDAENPDAAQNKRSLSGKILRIGPRGGVPHDNPFGNRTWTFGHRNPEQIAFAPDGKLWSSEFGDKKKDELNRIVRGANYGWPHVEGKDGPGGYHDPLATWDTDRCSPSGIAILAGRAWLGALQGDCIYSVRLSGPHKGHKERFFAGRFGRIRAVGAAPDGSLWIGTSNRDGRATPGAHDDRIFRVRLS